MKARPRICVSDTKKNLQYKFRQYLYLLNRQADHRQSMGPPHCPHWRQQEMSQGTQTGICCYCCCPSLHHQESVYQYYECCCCAVSKEEELDAHLEYLEAVKSIHIIYFLSASRLLILSGQELLYMLIDYFGPLYQQSSLAEDQLFFKLHFFFKGCKSNLRRFEVWLRHSKEGKNY